MVNQDTVLTPIYEKPADLEAEDSFSESLDEFREPTDDDLTKLRRVSETIPVRAWFVLPFSNFHLRTGSWSL